MTRPAKRSIAFLNKWEWLGAALFAVYLLRTFFIFSAFVPNYSMEPLLSKGEWVISISYGILFQQPQQGDIVLLENFRGKYTSFKKISAVPGDSLETDPQNQDNTMILHQQDYQVAGNQAMASIDSRDYGPISLDQIKGKALLVLWPLTSVRWIKNYA